MTLNAFIDNSGLAQEDKRFWISILATMTSGQIKILADCIGNNEENLKILTENTKAKKRAFENRDEEALEKIIRGEQ
jgi:hypothetical protein